jgi:hypothetical protein
VQGNEVVFSHSFCHPADKNKYRKPELRARAVERFNAGQVTRVVLPEGATAHTITRTILQTLQEILANGEDKYTSKYGRMPAEVSQALECVENALIQDHGYVSGSAQL